ncbi:MAG: hypothetical protein HOI35_15185 [Woeseia sp.]|nr:hypothetical protein [Woeseia sp.]
MVIAIVAYLVWRIYGNRAALESLTLQWDLLSLAGALVSCILAYQCLLLGWVMLLRRAGYYEARYLGVYARIWWSSYLYRYIPGKILLIVERARMGSNVGIPASAGAALTIIETLLSILAGSAVSLLAIAYYAAVDKTLVIGVLTLVVGFIFIFPWAYRVFCRVPFINEKYPELKTVALRTQDVLIVVLPYIFYYLLLGVSFFLITKNLQLFGWSDLAGLCGIYALSHVISLVALLAPAGLGVREGAFAVQLGRLVPPGVSELLAIGARVWFTIVELLCYFCVALFCPALPTENRTDRT